MRLSTSGFYDASAKRMATLSVQAERLNAQIAAGKRLQVPSDDALGFRKLERLALAEADDAAYRGNLSVAAGALAQADSTLDAMAEQMRRASELTLRAANGTLTAENRKAIGIELRGIAETIAGLINRTDPRGEPLFGGADGQPGAVRAADGSWRLATAAPSPIPIGEGQSVQTGEPAARVLGLGATDALTLLDGLAAALEAGGELPAGAVDDVGRAGEQVTLAQSSLGARAARVELAQAMMTQAAVDRDEAQGALEGSRPEDITAAVTELQKTMTILQATQASFAKLQTLSLFDYLR